MKKFSFAFLSLAALLILSSCGAQKKAVQNAAPDKYQPLAKSLLWEISHPEVEKPSYLFGTIHLIDKDKYFLPKGTLESLDKAKEIVFEVDLNEMKDIGNQMGLLSKAYMNNDLTLSDLLTKEEYKEVDDFFKNMGLPLFFFERMKPMFLSVLASMDGDMSDMQARMTSYEFELSDMASARGLSTSGLETLDFQIGLFDSIPYENQAQMLLKGIRDKDKDNGGFDDMVEMYKTQNIDGMLTTIEGEDLANFEHLLLTKRNKAWIPIMKEKVNQQPTFFAVGAGHLAGEEGVVWLLMKEGFTLKPLSVEDGTD